MTTRYIGNIKLEVVGYLIDGLFVCEECSEERQQQIPVAKENIGIYSQQCNTCHNIIVHGLQKSDKKGPLNLFSLQFAWSRLNYLKGLLNQAIKEQDWESYSNNERKLIKEFLNELPRLNMSIKDGLGKRMWFQIIDYVNSDYPRY